jgi:hypothetical protein
MSFNFLKNFKNPWEATGEKVRNSGVLRNVVDEWAEKNQAKILGQEVETEPTNEKEKVVIQHLNNSVMALKSKIAEAWLLGHDYISQKVREVGFDWDSRFRTSEIQVSEWGKNELENLPPISDIVGNFHIHPAILFPPYTDENQKIHYPDPRSLDYCINSSDLASLEDYNYGNGKDLFTMLVVNRNELSAIVVEDYNLAKLNIWKDNSPLYYPENAIINHLNDFLPYDEIMSVAELQKTAMSLLLKNSGMNLYCASLDINTFNMNSFKKFQYNKPLIDKYLTSEVIDDLNKFPPN